MSTKRGIFYAGFLILCVVFTNSCKPKKTQNFEEMARRASHSEAVLVKSVKLEPSVFYHELISNGKIYSRVKAVVPFRTNGIITEVHVINGQKVNAGDLLAAIDDFQYRTELKRAQDALERAEISYKNDLISYTFNNDSSTNYASKVRMSSIRSGYSEAQNSLEIAKYNFDNTRIHSPVSGVVANLDAKQWNPSQNYKNLCTIINVENLEVEFPVIESEYGIITKGMPVGIVPYVTDSVSITGIITQINPEVDENGMIKVKAEFTNNGRLIDGMNVKVIIRKPVPGRLVVPKEAMVIRQGRDVIFIRQDSLAIWKYVTVEFENSSSVSIKDTPDGIHPGDLVIVSGNVNLAHETVVREQ
jgi:membrane fusion protein, multidrug efflux system